MKFNYKRMMALCLSVMMMLAVGMSALAIPYDPGDGGDLVVGDPIPTPPPAAEPVEPTSSDVEVMFHGGDILEGELDVRPELLDKAKKYHVTVNEGSPVPEYSIPDTKTVDEFYEQIGWVLEDDYKRGYLDRLVDMKTFVPSSLTTFVAVYKDTWTPYKDMRQDRGDWFYKYVRDLSIAGVVNGYPGNVYKSQGTVTWGEALKLIMLATGYDEQAKVDSHWASGYLARARADGLVDAERKIDLNAPIDRLDIAEVASKSMKLPEPTIQTPFADTAEPAVLKLYVAGIVEGNLDANGARLYHPMDNITRAEISAIIWRIENLSSK